jgi:hypothetical protein
LAATPGAHESAIQDTGAFLGTDFVLVVNLTVSEWYETFQSVVSHLTARHNASGTDLLDNIAKG